MEKSPEAFRTISEVADWLGVPTHVLRFWESRFSQIKPVKRAGGRRYYRPNDMALIGGIKRLLHDEGMTIRGAQKLLREKGVKHVAAMSQPLDGSMPVPAPDVIDATAVEVTEATPATEDVTAAPAPEDDAGAEPVVAEPVDPASVAPEPEPEADAAPAEAAPIAIPATPDVPDTDPDDSDTGYPAAPGIAARLRLAHPAYLRRNQDALRAVQTRLQQSTGA